MDYYFQSPTTFRLSSIPQNGYELHTFDDGNDAHPSIGRLCMLVFEAVLEVVCVSLPGYIIARLGHFDAEKQKFLANLNVMLFTPCLIFTKLASQLSADKLSDLAIIPIIFIVQTLISWIVARLVAKACRFNARATNFITAMGVFGNSNSLPISLVVSLSETLKGLHWDRIPGDTDDEVAARGILYLLIFQQLGQLVRWSWGYHVLLAPKDKYPEYQEEIAEEGQYRDDVSDDEQPPLIEVYDSDTDFDSHSADSQHYEPAGRTPVAGASRASLADMVDEDDNAKTKRSQQITHPPENHPTLHGSNDPILSFPQIRNEETNDASEEDSAWTRTKRSVNSVASSFSAKWTDLMARLYQNLPAPIQSVLKFFRLCCAKAYNFLWEFMNPPLWAMLIAVLVASVPALQDLFFKDGSFVKNSFTDAVQSSGGVAVPLILVVLGANLARNTMAKEDQTFDPEEEQIGTKLLAAALVSRMFLPTLIMAPFLAITAKYINVSILDDPIFIVVCFLLSGAPSALQLAQICQINQVFEKTMGKILFQSYVVWILPSTLVLVMLALKTVEWAT